MKMLSFLASVLISGAATAGTVVYHNYDGALRGIALNNACVTASDVQTIKDVRHCTKLVGIEHKARSERDNTYTEWVCANWEVSKISYPRAFERTVCEEYSNPRSERDNLFCKRSGQRADFLPNTIKIRTVTESGDHNSNFPGVTSNFTFPACN
jgi:hypothetical protein